MPRAERKTKKGLGLLTVFPSSNTPAAWYTVFSTPLVQYICNAREEQWLCIPKLRGHTRWHHSFRIWHLTLARRSVYYSVAGLVDGAGDGGASHFRAEAHISSLCRRLQRGLFPWRSHQRPARPLLFINHLRFFLPPHPPRAWRSRCFFYCTSYVLHCTSRAGGEASFPPLALFCDKDTSRTDKRRNVCYLQVRGKGKKGFWALCTGSGSRTARKHPGRSFVWPGSCSRWEKRGERAMLCKDTYATLTPKDGDEEH